MKPQAVGRYNYPDQFGDRLPELLDDIQRMLLDAHYILSSEVTDFEREFSEYLGTPHVAGLNSGTDALILSLMALGIGPGDEVITQANTFHATVSAICVAGATPVLVDAVDDSFLMNVDALESAITDRTRVILPTHLFGKTTPMQPILTLAAKHDLHVVEDACQAHGAEIDGQSAGTFGVFGCFSFHPSKNLAAAGDGGAVVTSDPDLDAEIRCRRSLGQSGQNHHVSVGLNSKLDAIQARILSWKLPRLETWNEQRRQVARWYRERLAGQPIGFQEWNEVEKHVFHLFQIRTKKRDELMSHLKANGIDATVRYPTPIHLQPAFADRGWKPGQFPVAEHLADELLCLPLRPDMSVDEVDYVSETVQSFFGAQQIKGAA